MEVLKGTRIGSDGNDARKVETPLHFLANVPPQLLSSSLNHSSLFIFSFPDVLRHRYLQCFFYNPHFPTIILHTIVSSNTHLSLRFDSFFRRRPIRNMIRLFTASRLFHYPQSCCITTRNPPTSLNGHKAGGSVPVLKWSCFYYFQIGSGFWSQKTCFLFPYVAFNVSFEVDC